MNKNILISGAGIAGLTLCYWLRKYGFNPTVVEEAPTLRSGGYMIDFWGKGFDVAERMGLLPALREAHYNIPEIKFVNRNGKHIGHFSVKQMRKQLHYRHVNLLRGELAVILYQQVKDDATFIWGNTIERLQHKGDKVDVWFADGKFMQFDLVMGTDGLHSAVRRLTFGPEEQFERFLGYYTASFTIDNYLGKDNIFYSYSTPGRQVGIYSTAKNKLSAFFIFRSTEKVKYEGHRGAMDILRKEFGDAGWECPALLSRMQSTPDFYFDAVSQIVTDTWSKERIVLAGDACQCVSLIAGQGAALAMAGAYVLAGELKDSAHYEEAFRRYTQIMMPEIRKKQELALGFASSFVPKTNWGIKFRNVVSGLMDIPLVSRWFINKFLLDSLVLKDY